MPDNINETVSETSTVESDATPVTTDAVKPETSAKPHVSLAESALESSLSDVLPLSPIGETEPATQGVQREKKNERRGLRRGNGATGKSKIGSQSASVGIVENPAEVVETLSGTGPKPRKEREPRENRFNRREENPINQETPESAPFDREVKPGAGWTIQEKKERNFHHIQSNTVTNNRPKLIIEPAKIPEQEAEPSFWERLKARILALFKIGKKKNKKRGNKRRGGKFHNDNRNNGGKDFRYNNRKGKQNFNKNRFHNSNFRGNKGNGRSNNGGPKSES